MESTANFQCLERSNLKQNGLRQVQHIAQQSTTMKALLIGATGATGKDLAELIAERQGLCSSGHFCSP